jgi:hypothetical protein
MTVEVDLEVCLGRTIALLTGGLKAGPQLQFDLVEPRRADYIEEELRYYSHSGKTIWTPLWHVHVSKHDSCLSLEQYLTKPQAPPQEGEPLPEKKTQVKMTECSFCCRKFPHVPQGESRTLREILLSRPKNFGMVQCSLCESESSSKTAAYYCDRKCQQQALVAHSGLRHNGIDISKHIQQQDSKGVNWKKKLSILLMVLAILSSYWLISDGPPSGLADNNMNPYVADQGRVNNGYEDDREAQREEDDRPTGFSADSSPDGFVREL